MNGRRDDEGMHGWMDGGEIEGRRDGVKDRWMGGGKGESGVME